MMFSREQLDAMIKVLKQGTTSTGSLNQNVQLNQNMHHGETSHRRTTHNHGSVNSGRYSHSPKPKFTSQQGEVRIESEDTQPQAK